MIVNGFAGWSYLPPRNAVYLLSHFHSDHYRGLSRHFDGGLIYCKLVIIPLAANQYPLVMCIPLKVLPRQSDAIQFIADRIESLLSDDKHGDGDGDLVILIGTYSIGKERILERVAKQCQTPLYIDSAKRNIFGAVYGAEDPLDGGVFTADLSATKVRVVWMRDIAFSEMRRFKTSDRTKVVGFRPTGWASKDGRGRRGGDRHVMSPRYSKSMVIYDVPYSEHSSFPELCKFISDLRPKQIVPTVNNWSRSAVQQQLRTLQHGMDSFAVTGYRYLPLVEDNGLKQTAITQFISSNDSVDRLKDHDGAQEEHKDVTDSLANC